MSDIRILVAEDNEDHRFFIVRALHELGDYQVDVVTDGVDALDFLYRRGDHVDQQRPHLILLDLKMPRVGGLEVIEHVKNDPELRSIPIAVLTSSDRKEDIDAAYGKGGNTYIVKDASVDGLRRALTGMSEYWTELATLPDPPA